MIYDGESREVRKILSRYDNDRRDKDTVREVWMDVTGTVMTCKIDYVSCEKAGDRVFERVMVRVVRSKRRKFIMTNVIGVSTEAVDSTMATLITNVCTMVSAARVKVVKAVADNM